MVYKRYIKKNGKVYGPYSYKSVKKNGKVITEYLGRGSSVNKKKNKSSLKVFLFLCVFGIIVFGSLFFLNLNLTGNVVLSIEDVYREGESLQGNLNFVLDSGEFIPASTHVIVELGNSSYNFVLSDLIKEDAINGRFHIDGKNLSGDGKGYGVLNFSIVSFVLGVYSEESSNESENISEITEEDEQKEIEESISPTINEDEEIEDNSHEVNETETNGTEVHEEIDNNISESEVEEANNTKEVQVNVEQNISNSKDNNNDEEEEQIIEEQEQSEQDSEEIEEEQVVEESTQEEDNAEVIEESSEEKVVEVESEPEQTDSEPVEVDEDESEPSVTGNAIKNIAGFISNFFLTMTGNAILESSINGEVSYGNSFIYNLSEGQAAEIISSSQDVDLTIENNQAIITTDYKGEGKEILVDISKLNISAEQGELKVYFVYNNTELLSESKFIGIGSVQINETEIGDTYFVSENISVVNFWMNKYNDISYGQTVSRVSMRLNNSDEYLASRFVNITIAYPSDQEFLGLKIRGTNPIKEEALKKEIEKLLDENKVEESWALEKEYSKLSSIISVRDITSNKKSKHSEISDRLDGLNVSNKEKDELEINDGFFNNELNNYNLKTYEIEFSSDEEYLIQAFASTEYGLNEKLYMYIEGSFAGGTGTSGDPWQITNWTNLAEVGNNLTASYILMNNLSSSTAGYDELASPSANSGQGWEDIASSASDGEFYGTFDGQNYTISDMHINRTGSDYKGLFAAVDGASISNLNIENATLKAGTYSGIITGRSQSSYFFNIHTAGNVNCSGGVDQIAGIIGRAETATILNCSSSVNLHLNDTGSFYVGGIVGYGGSTTIVNSYATGNILGDVYNGGLAGFLIPGQVNSSYATGDVLSDGNGCGGFIGYIDGGTVRHSFSTGTLTCNSGYAHGFVGRPSGTIVFEDNYYDSETSGYSDTTFGGTPKTTVQMMSIETFDDNWSIMNVSSKADNFANWTYTWNIVNGSTYPFLSLEHTQSAGPSTINTWNCSSTQRFDNSSCWSLGSVPVAGEDVFFNSTGTGNCNITNSTMPQNLSSFTVESGYTGTIYFNPLFANGSWTGNDDGNQLWNVSENINISGGTMKVYGDYLHSTFTGEQGNTSEEGHGQEWRSVNGNISIGSSGFIDGIGLGFPVGISPTGTIASGESGTHGGRGGGTSTRLPYGNASAPVTLGAGGGEGDGGSGIKLYAVDFLEIDGTVDMSGDQSGSGRRTGAGGSIWLIADNISGRGSINASGAYPTSGTNVGGGGRIKIEYTTYLEYIGSIAVGPGLPNDVSDGGDAGTLTFTDNTWPLNLNITGVVGFLGGDYGEGEVLNVLGNFSSNDYNIWIYGDCFMDGSSFSTCYNSTIYGKGVWINASGDINISSGTVLNGIGIGFPLQVGPEQVDSGEAGTHAGVGGNSGNSPYGNESFPTALGTGGGEGRGGSAIHLQADEGTISIEGNLSMYSDVATGRRRGAGGSIWIEGDIIEGEGNLLAQGSAGDTAGSGGGRVALTSGSNITFSGVVDVSGGADTSPDFGGGGSFYLNATTKVVSSMNITTYGEDGGNISMYDGLFTLSGYYNATGTNADAVILINYTDCSSDFSGATFNPSATYETGCAGDNEFPIFYNITDNNATLINSGIVNISSSINNTNGTAGVQFDGTNYSMTNISAWFNTTFTQSGNGTFEYFIWAYGNGTNENFNNTDTYYYFVKDDINTWNCSSTQRFDNSSCWSLGTIPLLGENIVFNSTGTGDCNITNNTMPQNLTSFTVESGYTGTIYFDPLFAEGDWTGNSDGNQEWNVTHNINISGGTMKIYGDYLHSFFTGEQGNTSEEGHGQEWRSVNGNITIGTGGIIDGAGLGFYLNSGPGSGGDYAGTHGGIGYFLGGNGAFKNPYGNASAPVSLGSGANTYAIGGSAIKLQSDDEILVEGLINMSGTSTDFTSRNGAGGSIWLIADNISGKGRLYCTGQSGSNGGGGGYIRLGYLSSLSFAGIIDSSGGLSTRNATAGPLTFTDNTWPGDWNVNGSFGLLGGNYGEGEVVNVLGNFNAGNNNKIDIYGDCFGNSTALEDGNCYNTSSEGQGVWINASGNITIGSGSILNGRSFGFPIGEGPGTDHGAAHGGAGDQGAVTITYGNETQPISLGSGAAYYNAGGSAIKLETTQQIIVDGEIWMNPLDYGNRDSAGGSIWLKSTNISGSGILNASGDFNGDYGGGGGRISLTSSGTIEFVGEIHNLGGVDSDGSSLGSGGTVFINASDSISSSMNILATGYDGGNISMYDTLFTLSGNYNASTVNATAGGSDAVLLINYTDCSSDFSGATFNPSATYETDCVADDEYPQFSSYWDNNATLINSGTAWFNVTLSHFNGTVGLEIGETNYSAHNVTATVFNTTASLTTNGTFPYYWWAYGNGTNANYNTSEVQYYTVNYTDNEYPQFYNITDNNATLINSGTVNISSSINNTNGTAGVQFDGTNYSMTNISAWFNTTFTQSVNGTFEYFIWAYGNGTSENFNNSDTYYYTVNFTDYEYPQFSNHIEYPANYSNYSYGTNYMINITISHTNATVGLEFNGTNYTAHNSTANEFNVTIGDLTANNYSYYWWAYGNGTSANYNTSDSYNYILNSIIAQGSISGTSTITFGTAGDVQGSESNDGDGDITYTLFRDNVSVSNPDTTTLGAGSYHYIYNTTSSGANYTDNSSLGELILTVNQAGDTFTPLLNGATANLTVTFPQQINVSVSGNNSELTILLNGTSLTNSANYTIGVGVWFVNISTAGNQNYTANESHWYINITQATGEVYAWINNVRANYSYNNGTDTFLNATLNSGSGDIELRLNGSIINSGSSPLSNVSNLSLGFYNLTSVYAGNQNYTSDREIWWINLTSDTSPPLVTIVSPTATTYTSQSISFEVSTNENSTCNYTVDSGVTNTSMTANASATGFTKSQTLSNANYVSEFYCWDVYNNLNDSENVSFTVSYTAPSGGTGGTGGSSSSGSSGSKPAVKFSLGSDSYQETINLNRIEFGSIDITNEESSEKEFEIELIGLGDIIYFKETQFTLAPGESRKLEFKLIPPNDTGVYTGKIVVKSSDTKKEILSTLNVQTENSLFDIILTLPEDKRTVDLGENLEAQIDLYQMGIKEKMDVTLNYVIKDFDGNVLLVESETIAVEDQKMHYREFYTKELPPGDYVLGIELIYLDGVAVASSQFKVKEELGFNFKSILILILVAILITVFVIVSIKIKTYKKIARRVKNRK